VETAQALRMRINTACRAIVFLLSPVCSSLAELALPPNSSPSRNLPSIHCPSSLSATSRIDLSYSRAKSLATVSLPPSSSSFSPPAHTKNRVTVSKGFPGPWVCSGRSRACVMGHRKGRSGWRRCSLAAVAGTRPSPWLPPAAAEPPR
jgi:hypothetical protein